MSFKFIRNTTETYHNSYEVTIDKEFCKAMMHAFVDADIPVIKPITPELVFYYMNHASKLGEWENLTPEEQRFADHIMDYCDDIIYSGDMWTYKTDINRYVDEWVEI